MGLAAGELLGMAIDSLRTTISKLSFCKDFVAILLSNLNILHYDQILSKQEGKYKGVI
jgi:hypothetical protein